MRVNKKNSDGTVKRCPNGSNISYPTGTLKKIAVGSMLCVSCPLFNYAEQDYIICKYNKSI